VLTYREPKNSELVVKHTGKNLKHCKKLPLQSNTGNCALL